MRNMVLGILAHVDAGKTTLSEGLLYETGQLRRLGRVDHKDSFLDGNALERERGITIFSKQAVFPLGERQITLLDTPGHVDFSTEMERALQVMDCALLVVSGTDGVQSHTRTLWRLLERYHVPTAVFVNKMDLPCKGQAALMAELKNKLDEGCVDFTGDFAEDAALCDEDALTEFLSTNTLRREHVVQLIDRRKLFPCWFGSALKLEGVSALLKGLEIYLPQKPIYDNFSAQVYKVEHLPSVGQITHLKINGGQLRVKTVLSNRRPGMDESQIWEEKIDQIRLYSGEKYQTIEVAEEGMLCAVTGLSQAYPGQVFGNAVTARPPALEPVRAYQVILPQDTDPYAAYQQLLQLEQEDPQLHVTWNPQPREIHLRLMGEIQGEVLRRVLANRFGLMVDFGPGSILYRETLASTVMGVGHFEPLRHYAEAHLLIEPAPPGSGVHVFANCPQEMLDFSWQRLIVGFLEKRSHPGVLIGAPLTDVNITLVAGRAHPKHTEGGDFRQAAYRALRQGLMSGECVLLEPWLDFRLEIPAGDVGRAMNDLSQMGGKPEPPETLGDEVVIVGSVPAATFGDYAGTMAAYTHGMGRVTYTLGGYFPCHDQEKVVAASGYDPERDADNPADSIFCSHGAGHAVSWQDAPKHMHVSSGLRLQNGHVEDVQAVQRSTGTTPYTGTAQQDKELQAIFERTYGPIKSPGPRPMTTPKPAPSLPDKVEVKLGADRTEYLLVDGYNIIFAWDELKELGQVNLDGARQALMELLCNYQGYRGCRVILVFDAYKVHGGLGEVSRYHNIMVVYTKEAETADAYIEKATYQLGKDNLVRVATSDRLVQVIILGHGALRISATSFHQEVEDALGKISTLVAKSQLPQPAQAVAEALRKAENERKG